MPSTPSSARTASVTGLSVSSSGSSGAPASAEPVAALKMVLPRLLDAGYRFATP